MSAESNSSQPLVFELLDPDTISAEPAGPIEYAEVVDSGVEEGRANLPAVIKDEEPVAEIIIPGVEPSPAKPTPSQAEKLFAPFFTPGPIVTGVGRAGLRGSSGQRLASYHLPTPPSAERRTAVKLELTPDVQAGIGLLEASIKGARAVRIPSHYEDWPAAIRAGEQSFFDPDLLETAKDLSTIVKTLKKLMWEDASLSTEQLLKRYKGLADCQTEPSKELAVTRRYELLADLVGAFSFDGAPILSEYYVDLPEYILPLLEQGDKATQKS